MDIGMDTGDMILTEKVEIGEDETTGELWNRLSKIGANLLVETLKQIENGTAPRIPQSDDFTLAPMLDKEMSKIDWQNKSALEILARKERITVCRNSVNGMVLKEDAGKRA